ncbi:hypothetical protein AAFN86_14755 [Roseomonas sp. CAU 1739]|uniref:hypothetical protein n=1 Tax=Roseomonas sp. CAU 1739 TaxID=3140364 RepID=UPI00325BABDD
MEVAGYTKTFSMDQGTVLSNDQMFHALFNAPLTDGKRQGICCGLSMVWAARRMMFHDETAEQRCSALVSTGGFRFGGRSQDIMMAAPDPAGGAGIADYVEAWFGPSLKTYVLRPILTTVAFGANQTAGGLAGTLVGLGKTAGTYTLYSMTFTDGAAHMVASYASHGTLGMNRHFYFFDPNMGEYRIGTGDAEKFLTKMFQAYEQSWTIANALAFEVERG